MVTDRQVTELSERAADDAFAAWLYDDPLGVLREQGYEALAADVERELARIDRLVGELANDDEFLRRVEDAPFETLVDYGLPADAVEPVLEIVGAPDEVLSRLSSEVELHGRRAHATAAAAAAVLGALAFAQTATAADADVVRYGSADPSAVRWSANETEGFRMGAEPEIFRYGRPVAPNAFRWGSQPERQRAAVGAFLRRAR